MTMQLNAKLPPRPMAEAASVRKPPVALVTSVVLFVFLAGAAAFRLWIAVNHMM